MVKVYVQFTPGGSEKSGDEASQRQLNQVYEVLDEVKPPQFPFWGLPIVDGDVVFINMALVRRIRMEKEKITQA